MPMFDDPRASLDRMRQELLEEEEELPETQWGGEEDSDAAESWEESDADMPEQMPGNGGDRGRRILVFLVALAALAWAGYRFLLQR